jgi:predicted secreted protein
MQSLQRIALIFLGLFLGVSAFLYLPRYRSEENSRKELDNLLAVEQAEPALGKRTKFDRCVLENNSPDPACTPGAIFPEATAERFCVSGYSKSVRNVSDKTRKEVFREYGFSYPQPTGAFEVDHLIPLAIGGSNDIANLFPQPAGPVPGFHEKDVVEVYLQEEICAGRANLATSRKQIAEDWLSIYRLIPEERKEEIKAKYKNWAN